LHNPTDVMEAEMSNYCQSGINSIGTGSKSGFDYTPSISPSLSDQRMSYSPTGSASAFFSVKSGYSAASPSAMSEDEQMMDAVESVRRGSLLHEGERFLHLHASVAEPWASISYYELNCRVGETFKVTLPHVTIDGGMTIDGGVDHYGGGNSQFEQRICLGPLSNVNRNSTIESTRRHIGKGIKMSFVGTQILINNNSEGSTFIQSRNANVRINLQSAAVCRVPAHSSFVLFDSQLFSNMLEKARCEGFQHVYELQKMCFVRLSFIKGWGADYQRPEITSTPCWIEVQFHQPLSWIDSALIAMEPPDHLNITSVS